MCDRILCPPSASVGDGIRYGSLSVMARPVRLGDAGFIGGGLAIVPVGTSLSANAAADVDPAKMKVQRRMILQFRDLVEPGRIQRLFRAPPRERRGGCRPAGDLGRRTGVSRPFYP